MYLAQSIPPCRNLIKLAEPRSSEVPYSSVWTAEPQKKTKSPFVNSSIRLLFLRREGLALEFDSPTCQFGAFFRRQSLRTLSTLVTRFLVVAIALLLSDHVHPQGPDVALQAAATGQ